LVLARVMRGRVVQYGLVAVAAACLLAGPFAYAVSTISRTVTGPFAAAGPVSTVSGIGTGGLRGPDGPDDGALVFAGGTPDMQGPPGMGGATPGPGFSGEDLSVDEGLVAYLAEHKGTADYLVAVQGATAAVPVILATGQPVMAMGGFGGADPAPTLERFRALVAAGRVHYVLVSGSIGMGPGLTAAPGMGGRSGVFQWVMANGTVVPSSEYGGSAVGTLYYVSSSGG
jgi:hypothetical protein